MDFYDIRTAVTLGISLVCIGWLYMLTKRNPQKTLFGKPVPTNLFKILITMFVCAGVFAVIFKPATIKQPAYIVIEPSGKVTKIY